MSCYKIPEGCCKNIEGMLSKFWWGSDERKRKIHWLSWEKMGKAKDKGGLDFRGFNEFNKALLGKQCWRLISGGSSLMVRVFKSRYYPRCNFMEAKIGFQPSYAWRSLMSAKEVIEAGARWQIGDDQSVGIWTDRWLPEQAKFKVWSPVAILPQDAKVCELIDPNTMKWRRDLVFSIFNRFEAQQIVNIPLSLRLPEDKLIWHWERDGEYSVRSAYHVIFEEKIRDAAESSNARGKKIWKEIWRAEVPNRIRNFLWRLVRSILPTKVNLRRKGVALDTTCPICNMGEEDSDHLFMYCQAIQVMWFASQLGIHTPVHMSLVDWITQWMSCPDPLAKQIFCVTLWKI